MAREHLGVGDGALAVAAAAVHDEHRGAVLGRPVPALEVEPVARLERDVAVGGARRLADRLAPLVRRDDAQRRSGRARRTRRAGPPGTATRAAEPGRAPAPRWRHGIATASPTSTTPAATASAPVTSPPAAPCFSMWITCSMPLTSARPPNANASAARRPGPQRREREHAGDRRRRARSPRPARAGRGRARRRGARTRRRARARGPAASRRRTRAPRRSGRRLIGASASSKKPTTRRSYSSGRAVEAADVAGLGDLPQRRCCRPPRRGSRG